MLMNKINKASIELKPFVVSNAENKLFIRIISLFTLLTVIFAIIIKNTAVPTLTREEKVKIPPQLTKFIERVEIRKKTKPIEEIKEKIKEIVKEAPKKSQKKQQDLPVIKTEKQKVELAREKAKNSGLLAMQDELAQLREISKVSLSDQVQPLSTLGSVADDALSSTQSGEKFVGTTAALNNNEISQEIGKQVELTKRRITEIADKEVFNNNDDINNEDSDNNVVLSGRDVESIRQILDRNKGAFYTIYRRALRKDPSLEGKVELLIVVASDGSVSSCSIISSELNSPSLERKLLARVKLINFGEQNVGETSINYSFNFLPF